MFCRFCLTAIMKKLVLHTFILFLSVFCVKAQQPVVKATIDSVAILVGQQTDIRLEVLKKSSDNINFPAVSDTVITGIEIVDISKIDTVQLDQDNEQLHLNLTVTSFDEGLYYIPPFKLTSNADTIFSNSLSLKVVAFEVDTVSKLFYDIKPVMNPDFVLADYIFILVIIWVILVILALIIYFVFIRKKKIKIRQKQEINVLPHVKAFAELEALKKQQLWQQEKYKSYYTKLTDILRVYLYERFNINAKEMTSDEILDAFGKIEGKTSANEGLEQVLKLADLVKFAKLKPSEDENELSFNKAELFVNQTQPEVITIQQEGKDDSKINS